MKDGLLVRFLEPGDRAEWDVLWKRYNAFYGREGPTALPPERNEITWKRCLDPKDPMYALVAVKNGKAVGLAHYLFHQSTSRPDICYLQDLYTLPTERGRGVGRALIERIYAEAKARGSNRVYWHTHQTNEAGRKLYDKVGEHGGFIVYTKEL